MDFTNVSDVEIPEGIVTQIHVNGQRIWTRSQETAQPDHSNISGDEPE